MPERDRKGLGRPNQRTPAQKAMPRPQQRPAQPQMPRPTHAQRMGRGGPTPEQQRQATPQRPQTPRPTPDVTARQGMPPGQWGIPPRTMPQWTPPAQPQMPQPYTSPFMQQLPQDIPSRVQALLASGRLSPRATRMLQMIAQRFAGGFQRPAMPTRPLWPK
jgi:hypothetical protein